MKKPGRPTASKREHEIMEILNRRGRATAAEVMNDLTGNPHYSTVRTQLRILENKGYVHHEEENLRYVYVPDVPQTDVGKSALAHLMDKFYDGSTENVVAALLGIDGSRLSQKKLDRIAAMVEKARKEARK